MNNVIFVTGNIIGESGHYVARNWIALADDSYKSRAIKIIEGDLVLTSEFDTIPYCEYAAHGCISSTCGNIVCSEVPTFLFERYLKEIEIIKRLAEIDVPDDLMKVHLKGLSSNVFAEFESFMIELLSALVFENKANYDKYIDRKKNSLDNTNLMDSVYQSIHHILGHKISKLKKEYSVIDITLPDTSVIENDINEIRHHIIHRSGKKVNNDHLERLSFTKEGLNNLIDDCNSFVLNVMDIIQKSN